eukprot:641067-Prorocentrum_minimum.AAC.1
MGQSTATSPAAKPTVNPFGSGTGGGILKNTGGAGGMMAGILKKSKSGPVTESFSRSDRNWGRQSDQKVYPEGRVWGPGP